MNDFDKARIILPDGRVAFDAVELIGVKTDGIFVENYPKHLIRVQTLNTLYEFITWEGKITGKATKPDGSVPRYLPFEMEVDLHGSTWGGSMLKMGYIGVGMYLQFAYTGHPQAIVTSQVQSVQAYEIQNRDPLMVNC